MKSPAAFFLALLCSACGKEPATVGYGAKVKYREGKPIVFPDFTLIYQGRRRVVPPQYPRGWWVYDFTVRAGASEQTVSWSAGTGLIDEADFAVGGKRFALERLRSDRLGTLKEEEVVISQAGDGNRP